MEGFGLKIRSLRESLGMSQEELARLVGYNDKSSISKIENSQRDISRGKVAEFAHALQTTPAYLMGWTDDQPLTLASDLLPVTTYKIPVIGRVHCGKPEYAEEDYIGVVDSEVKADFALKARGDSMIEAGIDDGDYVFVRRQSDVNSGELAVVLIDDEAAVKRVYKYPDRISLYAANPAYAPIELHESDGKSVAILGKVVAHLHYYPEQISDK